VLGNLLGNAIKFSPECSTVILEVKQGDDARTIFSVEDQGPGILKEDFPRLFDRYWQAQDTASKGTGLGLFICKSIIQAHGGRIEVRSRIGKGSTFCFSLPQSEPQSEPQSRTDALNARPDQSGITA
jgi:signal transduction histidine kinase